MARSFEFSYQSDYMAEFWERQETVELTVQLEYQFYVGHVYDTPLGKLGHGVAITDTKVKKVFAKYDKDQAAPFDIRAMYLVDKDLRKEVDRQIKFKEEAIIDDIPERLKRKH